MSDHFHEGKEWDDTPAYEDWHDLEHVDVEITEVHSSDWLHVRDLELEHTEFSHSHIHSEPSSELVKQHFPHLAPPPVVEEPLPILLWFGSFVITAALLVVCYEFLRYCVRAREKAKNAKKKKSKEKEKRELTSSGPLPLIDALRTLCKISHEMQNSNRAVLSPNPSEQLHTTLFTYAESHCNELSRLAYSLYEHVHKHFHQFEAISSDPSWLQLELEQEAEQDSLHHNISSRSSVNHSNGVVDVVVEVNTRIDSIIAALSPNTHYTTLGSHRTGTSSRKGHIEDRLNVLYAQRDLSEVKVQFSLVRDALLRVQCVSDKGYIHDILTRLRRAIDNRNEYHLLECTVLLQELHLHHSTAFSEIHDVCCTAEAILSEIHDQEDRNVRRAGQEKFLMDQNEMIDTFQAFSPREPNGSSKKQVFLTDSAKNRPINTPIVPETESKDTKIFTNNESCGIADESGLSEHMDNMHISEFSDVLEPATDTCAVDAAAPALSLDSSCLSPPESQKYPHTITSPLSNISHTSLTVVGTPLSPVNDTHKLISSQWAMEALRMRREAQSSVDRQLQSLKEKRKDKEQQARARARRSIEEREREKCAAKLFLEGLDEQRKSRQVAETEHFERQEKELLQEFAKQKEKQNTRDSRASKLFCIAAVVVYLLVYTKYNMYNGGVFGLYSWATNTLRNSCQFLACDKHLVAVRSEHTRSININDIAGGMKNPSEPAFLPIEAPYMDYTASDTCTTDYAGRQPSLKIVSAYQSTYRTTTQYLNSLVSVPMSTYALRYAVTGYVGSMHTGSASNVIIPGATGSGVLYEVYNGGRCVLHVLFRTLPSILLTKVISFMGLKKLSGWVAVFFTMLCFSDILLQMAVGPLLPLLTILCLHTILFQLITVLDEHRLRWMVVFNSSAKSFDVRSIVLYVIYPIVGLFVVWSCAQAPE